MVKSFLTIGHDSRASNRYQDLIENFSISDWCPLTAHRVCFDLLVFQIFQDESYFPVVKRYFDQQSITDKNRTIGRESSTKIALDFIKSGELGPLNNYKSLW